MLTEVVDRGRKKSRLLPHLVEGKINCDEVQKLTCKEIKCLYGLITIITSNYSSKLLKMELESRGRNVRT